VTFGEFRALGKAGAPGDLRHDRYTLRRKQRAVPEYGKSRSCRPKSGVRSGGLRASEDLTSARRAHGVGLKGMHEAG